jgi:hypothetical protein
LNVTISTSNRQNCNIVKNTWKQSKTKQLINQSLQELNDLIWMSIDLYLRKNFEIVPAKIH